MQYIFKKMNVIITRKMKRRTKEKEGRERWEGRRKRVENEERGKFLLEKLEASNEQLHFLCL